MATPAENQPDPSPDARPRERRILFLDDDAKRAELFLAQFPRAVWVETAADCLTRLEEPWDEVHLDHDLGGEHFVDLGRADCGMEIIRWLCLPPKKHLLQTHFYIHSHNPNAAALMVQQMEAAGYRAALRPFGKPFGKPLERTGLAAAERILRPKSWFARLLERFNPPREEFGHRTRLD
jgi:hypothetical protein